VLVQAVEQGYYDTPRGCTLTELSDELGLAKSTLSERLHRVEEKVVKEFLAGLDGVDVETVT
jgi:predicted DNA binding protein